MDMSGDCGSREDDNTRAQRKTVWGESPVSHVLKGDKVNPYRCSGRPKRQNASYQVGGPDERCSKHEVRKCHQVRGHLISWQQRPGCLTDAVIVSFINYLDLLSFEIHCKSHTHLYRRARDEWTRPGNRRCGKLSQEAVRREREREREREIEI